MPDVTSTPTPENTPSLGLARRLLGVVFSPREAYAAVAARPRALGALAVSVLIMSAAQFIFLSTEVGKSATLDQNLSFVRAVGANVTPEMVQQMESQMEIARYTTPGSFIVILPLWCAIISGLLLAVFTAILGGGATFKQVYAVAAHSFIISAIQQVFSLPIQYAREELSSPTRLSVFFPMLDEMGFATYLLAAIDMFLVWWVVNLSIGVAVLYKRRTGPVAAILLGIYAVIAVIIATVRAF
jgi:hypothetical protein